ncbi:urease accessory protein UreE [Mesorhizobium sp. CAU 1732]|uniref:urease accessory protein UreE n=1 Tax=Mesorhizobium sp. CAU 1732 TaxID=3140358 RepID=UPI0032615893
MKLDIKTDFTKLPRAGSFLRAADAGQGDAPFDIAVLPHDERHLRRRVLSLAKGEKVLVDLPEPVALEHGDVLVLDDGRRVGIGAEQEDVYDIRARDRLHLAELCWHIGNRHLAAQIEDDRILILRDHVIKDMLTGLGATVSEVVAPFVPLRGAYSGHGHSHGHDQHHHHGEGHGEPDRFGRLPDDPHYGHNHA